MANIQGFTAQQNAVVANVQVGDLIFVQKSLQPQYDARSEEIEDCNDYDADDDRGDESVDGTDESGVDERNEAGSDEYEVAEGNRSAADTDDTSNRSIPEVFAPTMFKVCDMTKDPGGVTTGLRVVPVTYAEKTTTDNGIRTFHIYGTEVITHHTVPPRCKDSLSLQDVAVDDCFVLQANPDGDHVRRFIATNPSRRCIANCRDGFLTSVNDLVDMIKDYPIPLLSYEANGGEIPGYFMKPVCPVCIGADITKEQQDIQCSILNIGAETSQHLFGGVVEFMGRLNDRRRNALGYPLEQFDERRWGYGAFDDMISESDEGEDDSGQFEHWEEAMDPSNNAPLRPTPDEAIASLPRTTFGQRKQEGNYETECVFEKEKFADDDVVVALPCGHAGFHEECIVKWLKQSKNCPQCRGEVEKPSSGDLQAGEQATAQPVLPPGLLLPGDDDFSMVNGAGMSGGAALAAALAASLAACEAMERQAEA